MIDLPVPTIIRQIEVGAWGDADAQMQRLGLPRHVRRAIEAEMKRIVGEKPAIQRATIDDLAKYAGEPKLGTFPFPVMSPKTASAPASPITYIGRSSGSYSGGTYTWTSAPIATGASDVVVIGIVRESSFVTTATSLTVNGSAATLWSPGAIQLANISGAWIEFYYRQPGALATANIVSTATSAQAYIFAWVLSGTTTTPLDVVSAAQATSTSVALNDIETKVSGAVMAIGVCEPTITGWTESWSGSETVTEDADFTSTTGNHRIVACHFATTSALTTQDLTLTLAASQPHIGGAISFGP